MLKSKFLRAVACVSAVLLLAGHHAQAADCGNTGSGFSGFIKAVHKEAAAQGIGRQALSVLDDITYDPGIVKKDRAQNIFSQSFLEFQARMITDYRIKHGAELVQKHKATFARVEKQFGVPAPVIVAFWALETDFGATSATCRPCSPLLRSPGIAGARKNSARN